MSKSIRKCLQCVICKDQLIGSKSLSKLQILKCSGVLTDASSDVIEICVISEKILEEAI